MSTGALGAVFDAMVFLQALVNEQGPAFACQRLVDEGKLTLFVSPAVLEEVKDVAQRPILHEDFRQRFPNLTILNPVALLKAFSPKQAENPAAEETPS